MDSRTLQSTLVSCTRAGHDGTKKRKGSRVHAAVDIWRHLLTVKVTPANDYDHSTQDLVFSLRPEQLATGSAVEHLHRQSLRHRNDDNCIIFRCRTHEHARDM